ncbi:hypothetical protein BH11MYX1_BH11MYX1_23650 [soil metagenome]
MMKFLLGLAFVVGCSETTASDPDARAAADSAVAATFSCADDLSPATCTTALQYCAVAKKMRSTGGISTDGQCLAKPSECNSCACASTDAVTAFTKTGGG